ncbi:uncharacterized protein CC84DRAFT_834741 [Paraphaeosphaeria sporulosa]|uniref:Uncharacterized protein n=1 Tax=Paraphaeosphaeria sporulosa TaxID=1460663 RepID=A0A177CDD7_9PLEO|nr:uncharacterized protein CC84DRAFT_834741 [Paraphaeosphaeria sporulosa]OAG05326.1 hypothetical protein CC84DRAFT_834741 [Paraphaeosphaeria sporulosa]
MGGRRGAEQVNVPAAGRRALMKHHQHHSIIAPVPSGHGRPVCGDERLCGRGLCLAPHRSTLGGSRSWHQSACPGWLLESRGTRAANRISAPRTPLVVAAVRFGASRATAAADAPWSAPCVCICSEASSSASLSACSSSYLLVPASGACSRCTSPARTDPTAR